VVIFRFYAPGDQPRRISGRLTGAGREKAQIQHAGRCREAPAIDQLAVIPVAGNDDARLVTGKPHHLIIRAARRPLGNRNHIMARFPQEPHAGRRDILIDQ